MATHRILRMEHGKDREGNDEIFVHIEVTDGDDVYTRADWLTKTEVAEILEEAGKPAEPLKELELVTLTKAVEKVEFVKARAIAARPKQLLEEAAVRELPELVK